MIIIGVDPGNVTGIAMYRVRWFMPLLSAEIAADEVGMYLRHYLDYTVPKDELVRLHAERYTITPGVRTAQPAALEVMGVLKDIARQRALPLAWSSPRTAKNQFPDDLLRKLKWYRRTKDGHANDGMRQVLAELVAIDAAGYLALTEPEI